MKLNKLLTPILGVATLSTVIVPITSSCSKEEKHVWLTSVDDAKKDANGNYSANYYFGLDGSYTTGEVDVVINSSNRYDFKLTHFVSNNMLVVNVIYAKDFDETTSVEFDLKISTKNWTSLIQWLKLNVEELELINLGLDESQANLLVYNYVPLDESKQLKPLSIKKNEFYTFKAKLTQNSDGVLVTPDTFRANTFAQLPDISINEDSITIKCNGVELEKNKDYVLTKHPGGSVTSISFNRDHEWKVSDVIKIKLSFAETFEDVKIRLDMDRCINGLSQNSGTHCPIQKVICGGDDGLWCLDTTSIESYTDCIYKNRYFRFYAYLGGWTTEYGKPTDWTNSAISMVLDFDDVDKFINSSFNIKCNDTVLTKDQYTITKISSNRIKITIKAGVVNESDDLSIWGVSADTVKVNNAFLMADTSAKDNKWAVKNLYIDAPTELSNIDYWSERLPQPFAKTVTSLDFAGDNNPILVNYNDDIVKITPVLHDMAGEISTGESFFLQNSENNPAFTLYFDASKIVSNTCIVFVVEPVE